MKIYLKQNVYDAALDRIRYLFDEFPNVVVGFSGGKDSTVTLQLALMVAEEKNRLPLKVMFLDQEAEWECVIDYIRSVMNDPRVEPMWVQVPFKIANATSSAEPWLHCWDESSESQWMRPKEPNSIKVNKYGTDRFAAMFTKFAEVEFPDSPMCYLGGVRCEESVSRMVGLTAAATYKHITYGKYLNRKKHHYTFYPIYDWSYTDVWKAIHSHKWTYCELYDVMFQYGVAPRDMRVSNVNHETAVKSLYYMQEFEPLTWNKLTKRIGGIKMSGQLKGGAFSVVKSLPDMFSSWKEYRDFLRDKLLTDSAKEKMTKIFTRMDATYDTYNDHDDMYRVQINAILANDYEGTKLNNWERSPIRHLYRRMKRDPSIVAYTGAYKDALNAK